MKNSVAEKAIGIIAEQSGVERNKLFINSRLEIDLGVTGDDVWEIIEDFESEFSVDWCKVDFSYYFHPETAGFFWSILNREKVINIKSFPITVGHLIKVAELGKWFKPEQVK